jgi:hypothetical protein
MMMMTTTTRALHLAAGLANRKAVVGEEESPLLLKRTKIETATPIPTH